MNVYTQEIPASVKAPVEALNQKLFGLLNTIDRNSKCKGLEIIDNLVRPEGLEPSTPCLEDRPDSAT
jgi:hypothetical protein